MPGISPPGDLHIEKGKPWEMFCILNTSHPDGQGGSWRNLSFYIDNKLAHEPMVKKFNETAIRLYVPISEMHTNSPPLDYYLITCKQNHVTGVCVRHVYVGCKYSFIFWHELHVGVAALKVKIVFFYRSSPRSKGFPM